MRFFLAHGALGIWDEAIFIGIAVIFTAFLVMSWFRSRGFEPELEDEPVEPTD
jgi:hypothetical protein